ncbi:MAG: DUF362 domain-containing protein [Spirochaetes bacterium]|nr:DUF362 domain-containing protein [Spirochaetota bacterium]
MVGDGPAVNISKQIASFSGVKKICEEEGVSIIDLKTPKKILTPDGKIAKFIYIARELDDFDKIINLPKLKNHGLTQITVAGKNLYGVIPSLRKIEYHFKYKEITEFNSLILELNRIVKPVINIVDAIVGMEGNGPGAGDPKQCNSIIMGSDTIAVDYIAARIMNYDPDSIPYFQTAREYNYGGYKEELIKLKGDRLEDRIVKDFKTIKGKSSPKMVPLFLQNIISQFIIKKPVISKLKCIGCGKCLKVCPPKVITLKNKKAKIKYKGCIKCYCCFEVCPEKAINLKIRPFS